MSFPPTNWLQTNLADLKVTSGSVSESVTGFLTVNHPRVRGVRNGAWHPRARLQFRYQGPSDISIPSGSGLIFEQIGIQLRAQNTCNVLSIMWRIEPAERVVIKLKSNPGQSRHEECENSGYRTLATIPLGPLQITAKDRALHQLQAEVTLTENCCSCAAAADDRSVWSGELDFQLISAIDGPAGFRTDNGQFEFQHFVAESNAQDSPS
jgi:hypothetical protein